MKSYKLLILVFTSFVSITPTLAEAAVYNFSIDGFSGGAFLDDGTQIATYTNGRIFGSFEGADTLDALGNPGTDGVIKGAGGSSGNPFAINETTRLSIRFSGNPYFDSLGSAELGFNSAESAGLEYIINNNALSRLGYVAPFGLVGEDYAEAITGHNIENLSASGFTSIVLGASGNNISIDFNLSGVTDSNGNVVDSAKRLRSISLSSNQELVVTQTPLPGALLLFGSGLLGLGEIRKKAKKM